MDWHATIKRYYELGCYSAAQVRRFAELGKLTAEQADALLDTARQEVPASEP
ncbi:XkdX family protein [Paenibacillus pasadenensis]|uniref:XkdX family protein n=1 Tax=Paenibacillus TaxID=44249 RepID=UPI00040F814C|nr:XkdX family protein [Paenibacillus pasadenensis]